MIFLLTAYFVVIFLVSSIFLAPNVAPSDVGGGGGSNRELTITWMVGIALRWHKTYTSLCLILLLLKPMDGLSLGSVRAGYVHSIYRFSDFSHKNM